MSDVYVAVYKAYKNIDDTTPVDVVLIGVYSDADKAVATTESIFDDEPQFYIGVGLVEFIVFVVEIEKTVWAVERGWRKVEGSILRVTIDKALRRQTKAEQERDIEALAEEYGRAVDEYESGAHK